MYQKVFLQQGKEMPIKHRHHWIFNGAIARKPNAQNGQIVQVVSGNNEILGHGYYNNDTVIAIRMLNFNTQDPIESLKQNIRNAAEMRKKIFNEKETNTYRVINGEGDFIPGLIVDKYGEVIVIQIATIGMEQLKPIVLEELKSIYNPKCIYEKSNMSARRKDGLENFEGILYGELNGDTEVLENKIKFTIDFLKAQKTGLFIDMREMRKLVGEFSKGQDLLNCFSYTGGFSLYAARNGAKTTTSIDIDPDAVDYAKKNFELNGYTGNNHKFIAQDVFEFLRNDPLQYSFVILDPPAFAKKKEDVESAKRGYAEINRLALSKMPAGSFLLTCSCSYHVNHEMHEEIVLRAARDAKRDIKILHKQRLAFDHPININHNEVDYLKSLLLYVS